MLVATQAQCSVSRVRIMVSAKWGVQSWEMGVQCIPYHKRMPGRRRKAVRAPEAGRPGGGVERGTNRAVHLSSTYASWCACMRVVFSFHVYANTSVFSS